MSSTQLVVVMRCSKAHDDDYRTSDAGIGLAYRDTPNAAR
jgi:hypothetical protein